GKAVKYHDDENLGVYNPWDWVTIDTKSAEKQILESKVIEKNCQLSSGIYKVILQPHIFVVNPDAKCGDQLSVLVTILRGGNSLLDKQAMQEFCLGNAPVLRGVKVMGGTGDLKLYEVPRHKFY
ncbi:MAG: hypothetical protein OEZ38_08405, partial [Gammaproteobacteria bacterium]|nr:hypothetical protein [Gammaproteobacteria bacterium]